ncbi:MAG TPA: glycosyltransferase family 39 protein [Pirellulaceae bacterium]|nr:glycosyltransferase family 39 protein [Pirellulaceae bacterium]
MAKPTANGTRALPWIVAGTAAVLTLVYLALFLSVRIAGTEAAPLRLQLFLLFLTPDDMLANMFGGRFAWQGVWDRLWTLGLAAAGIWCAVWIGWWPLHLVERISICSSGDVSSLPFDQSWPQRVVFAAAIGLHWISLLTLLVGLAGLLQTPILALIFAAAGVAAPVVALWRRKGVGSLFRPKSSMVENVSAEKDSRPRGLWIAVCMIAAVFAAVVLLGAALPPWDFDVLEYHLQVPKEWYLTGRIDFLPHNIYANMPLDAEMLPLAAMSVLGNWWTGAIVGKTAMGACALLTAIAIYGLVRRLASPLAAAIAAVVWLSHPWAIHVSVSGLNEQVYTLYFTLAVSSVATRKATWPNWLLCGFFTGAAIACKYPAVVMAAVPLAAWAVIAPRLASPLSAAWRARLAALTVFAAAAMASGGAWYVKNWVQAGNPVYPLLGDRLDGRTRTPEKNAQFDRGHAVPPYTGQRLAESLVRIGWQSEHQSPLLVPLVIFGLLAIAAPIVGPMTNWEQSLVIGTWSLVIFFLATWWLFTHRLDRFLVPVIPLAAVIAGSGCQFALSRPLKWVLFPLLAIGLLYNLAYVCWPMPLSEMVMAGDNRWLAPLEELRRDEPRDDKLVSRVNADICWLNANVPAGKAVLCVGEAAVFDLEVQHYYHTCFDDCLLVKWTAGKTTAERKQLLHERQVAYVYVDWNEIARYQSPGNYGFDPRISRALLEELVAQKVLAPPLADAPPEIYPVLP